MPLFQIDPIQDPRWPEFVERHPQASVYHSAGWMEALHRSYGYEVFAATTSPPGTSLTNGLPVCRVKSWLTGARLVSLPFSDHCRPLASGPQDATEILQFLASEGRSGKWDYTEVRPVDDLPSAEVTLDSFQPSQTFALHRLDLRTDMDDIFPRFHPSHIQRKIRRAEREGLEYEQGRSEVLLEKFYGLMLLTRRRHGLPPQPLQWFQNVIACLGDQATIHLASHQNEPVAAILTLAFKKTLVYKYGGSDARYHNLGSMPFLFWQAIQYAKGLAIEEFDLGRSDIDGSGLIDFKRHLGAAESALAYYRVPARKAAGASNNWKTRTARRVFRFAPGPLLRLTGRLLYRHWG